MARLTAAALSRFGEHWRIILSEDNTMMGWSLAKRGYLDVLKRRVPLYRLNALGRAGLRISPQGGEKRVIGVDRGVRRYDEQLQR